MTTEDLEMGLVPQCLGKWLITYWRYNQKSLKCSQFAQWNSNRKEHINEQCFCDKSAHKWTKTVWHKDSVAEWSACWTQAQEGLGSNRSHDAVGNSLRQTVHTHCTSVQAAQLVAALLRVARVTVGMGESSGSLLPGLWLTSPAGRLTRTGISARTLRSAI